MKGTRPGTDCWCLPAPNGPKKTMLTFKFYWADMPPLNGEGSRAPPGQGRA